MREQVLKMIQLGDLMQESTTPIQSVYDVSGVSFAYPQSHGSGTSQILKNVSLKLDSAESLAIVGPSGGGKSTLLRVMAGLLNPAAGTVKFRGADLSRADHKQMKLLRRRIGMTFQAGGLFDSMTCADNLRLALREAWNAKGRNLKDRVDKALAEVRLHEVHDLMVHEISGGMQKRLGIARALVLEPEVVLFDDPTAGLDPVTSRQIIELILEVRKRYKMTIVTVTSDVVRAYQIAERVGFFMDGRFEEFGSPQEIQNSSNPRVYSFVRGIIQEEEIE